MPITPGQWREVALTDDEWTQLNALLGREPTPVELGMFGAMWSEHCGYKHSAPLLRQLPTDAPWVVQGPGENAGAVDIGDGLAVVFKVESHNHPSAVEPYQGAATGVGGIVRDIFTMGARPIALLDSLRFGSLDRERNRYLFANVVAGIGGYGNCLGIPTVAGEVYFDASFDGNPIVNAMCVGIAPIDGIVRAKASGVGNVLMIVGAETGRDGLHGATFASVDDPEASHRGVIQVGNPFLEKLLLEACLELLEGDDVVAMQDLGAAGLTSSVVETASRGGVGADIDVQLVPRREIGMTAYEVMLSESQERMLLVVRPEGVEHVRSIIERWDLRAAEIGRVTDDGMVRVRDGETIAAEAPTTFFTDECPRYVRPAYESPTVTEARRFDLSTIPDIADGDINGALLTMLASPNIGSRRPIYEQYDHTILTNTVVPPGAADAAVLRLKGSDRGIAAKIDCNSRYCFLDPALGAAHAVAEATRNLSCVGAQPLAITNCLNFGNPEKPAGYYQLSSAVRGLAEACRALGVPVVSGNVSLYNETAEAAIMPTPTVGAVGVLADVRRHATMTYHLGDHLILVGDDSPVLGGSEFLAVMHGLAVGAPPPLDLDRERRVQETLHALVADGLITSAHDCGLGGLAVALAEMMLVSESGIAITERVPNGATSRLDERWFGESAARIVIACPERVVADVEAACRANRVPVCRIGRAEGDALMLESDVRLERGPLAAAWDAALRVV